MDNEPRAPEQGQETAVEPVGTAEPTAPVETTEQATEAKPAEVVVTEPAPVQETEPAPAVLSEAECADVLGKAQLPDPAKVKLAERQYRDRRELETAINDMAQLLSAVAQSGRPVRPHTARETGQAKRATLAEIEQAQNAVNARWLGTRGNR